MCIPMHGIILPVPEVNLLQSSDCGESREENGLACWRTVPDLDTDRRLETEGNKYKQRKL